VQYFCIKGAIVHSHFSHQHKNLLQVMSKYIKSQNGLGWKGP